MGALQGVFMLWKTGVRNAKRKATLVSAAFPLQVLLQRVDMRRCRKATQHIMNAIPMRQTSLRVGSATGKLITQHLQFRGGIQELDPVVAGNGIEPSTSSGLS